VGLSASTTPLRDASLCVFSASRRAPELGLLVGNTAMSVYDAISSRLGNRWAEADAARDEWARKRHSLELFLALEDWEDLLTAIATEHRDLASESPVFRAPVAEIAAHPLLQRPSKIVAVGLNYASHAAEADRAISPYPVLFAKYPNTLVGPADAIAIPRASQRIDYEGELGVVIGRRCADVPAADADAAVAGYVVANDVSARDYQFRTKEMLQGKNFDGFCPHGPMLSKQLPVHELGDLRLTTQVNGENRQDATLGEMIFDVPTLVEYISHIMTLEPGDLILTGTPAGIGGGMTPRRWLRPGDEVEVTIERVGTISNRVVASPGAGGGGRA
jgi:acylpyruvate hydrolase